MTWMLSGHTRELARERYRRDVVRACLSPDLAERHTLQSSAHRLYQALYASGFQGAAIVLKCEGDQTFEYDDGDASPLHCTVCFLGNAAEIDQPQRNRIISTTRIIGANLDPFTAAVSSPAKFGSTPVRLVEHEDFNVARSMALADPVIDAYAATYEDHPHFIPHVSGLDDVDNVRFDRIAALLGGEDHTFPLGAPYQPSEPGYTPAPDTQIPDLDLDLEKLLTQGVPT